MVSEVGGGVEDVGGAVEEQVKVGVEDPDSTSYVRGQSKKK